MQDARALPPSQSSARLPPPEPPKTQHPALGGHAEEVGSNARRVPEAAAARQDLGELLQPVSWQSQLTWEGARQQRLIRDWPPPASGTECGSRRRAERTCAERHVPRSPQAGEGQSPWTMRHLHSHQLTTTCPQLVGLGSSKGQLRARLALPSAPQQRSQPGRGAHHVGVFVALRAARTRVTARLAASQETQEEVVTLLLHSLGDTGASLSQPQCDAGKQRLHLSLGSRFSFHW